jgi:tripartite-type tricarboxylate transporter receptor subunit TctC
MIAKQVSVLAFVSAAFSITGVSSATAQNWPTRPVTIVDPIGAGAVPDTLLRIMTPRLSELLGQPVIIENASGAGGMIGVSRVAKAAPDGYQLVIGTAGTHAYNQTLFKTPLYDAATDFAPVALFTEQPLVLIARRDLPANNLHEFTDYTKTNQTRMQYGVWPEQVLPITRLACDCQMRRWQLRPHARDCALQADRGARFCNHRPARETTFCRSKMGTSSRA